MMPTIWTGGMIGWQLGEVMRDPHKLRELAIWYREFAERAGNPAVWEARLLTAEELEQEADRLDESSAPE
jgi:hypothetical protein